LNLHLAPNAPWLLLLAAVALLVLLASWAYRFAIPPLPVMARRGLTVLRVLAFAALAALLAQPVFERPLTGTPRIAVLLDRSRSMDLPGGSRGTRATEADAAVRELERAWRGRAIVRTLPFAARLATDSAGVGPRGITAAGDALAALAGSAEGQDVNAVVIVSDGVSNAGEDPVATARRLGVPVHAVVTGGSAGLDRAVMGVEATNAAQVGHPTPVRVHVTTTEERGIPLVVTLRGEGRELGRTTLISPGPGVEAVAEFHATPLRAGLAVWTAAVDSAAREVTTENDARQVAFPVAPGRLGVTLVSGGLNWDFTFLRRALAGDSALEVTTWVRERDGWRSLERGARAAGPGDVRGQAVVILDAISPADVGPPFDESLASFVRNGGGVLALGGPPPGIARYRSGRFGGGLGLAFASGAAPRLGSPAPSAEARDLLAWDDDPARGELAWRSAAPLSDLAPVAPGAGDRVLVGSSGGGPPLLFTRHSGRGQVLLLNGSGVWRWSLSGDDELTAERGRKLWRSLVQWLAEPVQGEALRVRPERWLSGSGEPARLLATLQDETFRPLAGAEVEGEVVDPAGKGRRVTFTPGAAGTYVGAIDDLPPGRYRVSASARRGGRTLGRAASEFAVDRWSLEAARSLPDSATLAAVAAATGGRVTSAGQVGRWARSLGIGQLARGRTVSLRLWESPWVFAVVVGVLSVEWIWRRRRGLP
jgi:hypothetical protein